MNNIYTETRRARIYLKEIICLRNKYAITAKKMTINKKNKNFVIHSLRNILHRFKIF